MTAPELDLDELEHAFRYRKDHFVHPLIARLRAAEADNAKLRDAIESNRRRWNADLDAAGQELGISPTCGNQVAHHVVLLRERAETAEARVKELEMLLERERAEVTAWTVTTS